jgi:hypothetical protein
MVQFLKAHPEFVGAYPDYDLIDADSKVIRHIRAPDYSAQDLIELIVCQPGPGALVRHRGSSKPADGIPR